jgi:uncharacterized BrkB/YihY/UPF0761 family membrane protein
MREQINQYIWSYNACDSEAPRSAWRHFLQILYMVGRDLMGGMVTLYAMSLVYTTLLSLVPLLAVSISVLKGFGVHDQLEPTLAHFLAPLGEQSIGNIVNSVCTNDGQSESLAVITSKSITQGPILAGEDKITLELLSLPYAITNDD